MYRTVVIALVTTLLPACGSGDSTAPEQPASVDETPAPVLASDSDAGSPAGRTPDPLDGEDIVEYGSPHPMLGSEPTGPAYRPPAARARTIEIILRSTPPGAEAAVDGKRVGPTPTFWRGKMTDKPLEFTFVLPNYTVARYRFVATTNGVVHATLEPLGNDDADAGPAAP